MSNLLPPNSTLFERNLSDISSKNMALPVNIRSISRIDNVPDQFLSFLAWQYSVDSWDNNWQPSLKRERVKKSFGQHRVKGTRAAVRNVLAQFGYTCTFTEWFDMNPIGEPGTFKLELDLNGTELNEDTYIEVNRLVKDAKPASRHMTNLIINVLPLCVPRYAVGLHSAETVTIYAG